VFDQRPPETESENVPVLFTQIEAGPVIIEGVTLVVHDVVAGVPQPLL
jgi:hypothetical protein